MTVKGLIDELSTYNDDVLVINHRGISISIDESSEYDDAIMIL